MNKEIKLYFLLPLVFNLFCQWG